MGEEILDVIDPLLVYTILGGFILFYGLVSLIVKEKLFLSEAFVATFMGLIVGPACLNWINPMHWENKDQVTEELTRIVLAIQVMAAGINLPRAYITRQFTSMAIMLLPVMVWMWITSAVIIYHFISELTFLESLLIASCITPTDPILANSIVQGSFAEKHIPSNVRHLLSAESGANDGMGFPFMFLALYLLQKSNTTGSAISQWIYFVWGYHILFSIVIGIIIGWGAKKLLEIARSKNWIDKESFLVFAIALAIFVVGGVSILGSDALLSCFTAGSILAWDDWFRQETRDAHLQEVIDLLLTLTTFTYIGMIVPWSRFNSDILSLQRLIPISILILIFRRLPIVLTLKKFIPAIHTFKEAMFAGYFGPIGVGAVFLAMTVKNEVEKRENDMDANIANRTKDNVFPIVAFIVISSVVVHGITVPILNIGSRIDIERLPTIASISDQVARLPIVDFMESLSVEHDAQGSVRKKEKTRDEIVNSDEGDDSDHDDNGEYEEDEEQHEEHHQNPHHGIRIEEEEEGIDESDNNSVKDEIKTNILIDLGNGDDEEVDNQSQSSKNKLPSRNSSESVDNISSDYNQNNQK